MPNFHTDSYFCIGAAHLTAGKPCQDYALSETAADVACAIVCDGCSTGGRTDVGARILALATMRSVLSSADGGMLLASATQQGRLETIQVALGLNETDLLSTCVSASLTAGNLRVVLEGKGPVTLRPNDHIATGGEGSVYKVGDMAVKMYLDPLKMRRAGLPEKVKALSQINHPYIVSPRGLALNAASEPVGHYLPFVQGHPLSLVFTNDFWSQEGFGIGAAATLVARMRQAVDFAHQATPPAILVDANELNWIAVLSGQGPEPKVIDVDSWAIGKWAASVIMPSIRDWNSSVFDQSSDWFSWAIVTFQVFTGIHPYKGTLAGFDRGDLVGRMKANASVFSPGVKINRAVRDFAVIPNALRSWYEAVFQQGARGKPPDPLDGPVSAAPAARVARTVVLGSTGTLSFEKILSRPGDAAVRTFFCGAVLTASGALLDLGSRREIGRAGKGCEVAKTEQGWLIGEKSGFRYVSDSLRVEPLALQVEARSVLSYENRMFTVTEQGLVEIHLKVFGSKPIASVGQTWGVMTNATRWFEGFGVFDAMGAMFVVLPFGAESVAQVRIELDGLKVMTGKAGSRFASMVALDKQGAYRKIELTFDKDYALPPKVWLGHADSAELNLTILPKGVCATIVKDAELDIFVPTTGTVRRVADSQIATDMALSNWRDTVIFIQNGDVWSLRLT